MSDSFLNELQSSFDKAAVLTGSDIDARYFTDTAGRAAPKPRAVVRPKTTDEVSRLLKLCDRERVAGHDAGRHDRASCARPCRMRARSCCRWSA